MKRFVRGVLRRRLGKCLAVLAIAPFVLWGGLNLFFLTPLGCGLIERQVTSRLRVGCHLDSLSWSPWAGVTLSEIRLLAPEGCGQEGSLLEADRISVDLSWSSLMMGKLRWEKVEVTGVRVDLSIEALRAVMAKYEVAPQPRDDQKSAGDRLARNDQPDSKEAPNLSESPGKGEKKVGPAQGPGQESPVGRKPDEDFEGVVVFSEVDLRLFSIKVPDLSFGMTGIKGEIPLWGAEREGSLGWDELTLGRELKEAGTSLAVSWLDQSVRCNTDGLKVFGLDCQIKAIVRLSPGYPFGLQVDLPSQDVDFSPVYQSRQSPLEIKGLASRNVLQGYLTSPAAFRAKHFSSFDEFIFHDLSDGGDSSFERGRAVVVASAAGLVIQDLRAIGQDDAVLLNGFSTFGGEAAATVRIVSSPERAASHEKRVRQASSEWTLDFQPLMTPDRLFRDLRLEWRDGQVMIDLMEEREWAPFWPVMQGVFGKRNTTFSMKP